MHQRPSNNSAKPASGPDCSVPAMGCAGMRCTPVGNERPDIAQDRRLDRTDVAHDRARLQIRRSSPSRSGRKRRQALRAPRDRRRARPARACRAANPQSRCPSRFSSVSGRVRIARDMARQARRADRMRHGRADQADADQRDLAEDGLGIDRHAAARHEFGKRLRHATVRLFAADRHAQAIGQTVIAERRAARCRANAGNASAALASCDPFPENG